MDLRGTNSILPLLVTVWLLCSGCLAYAEPVPVEKKEYQPSEDGHQVRIVDLNGSPLAGYAVIAASGLSGNPVGSNLRTDAPAQVMDQRNEHFVPDLLIVPRGGRVEFPNSDRVMHHVYSFSDAKNFEIPLYQGRLPSPVVFDKPGLVVLGCNIHDQMIGHILVVDTAQFGISDADGLVLFDDPPAEVVVWRPGMGAPADNRWPLNKAALTEIRIGTGGETGETALSWNDY